MEPFDLPGDTRAAVLVEGASDREAVLQLARRVGRVLETEGVVVVAMGGATNVGAHVWRLGPAGRDVRLAGLYDRAEARHFDRALRGAGVLHSDEQLADAGFFECDADLEDELIRAMGTAAMLRFLETQGDLGSFRIFQNQPAQRRRSIDRQLRRFIGTRGGRKVRYAPALVAEIEMAMMPDPLRRLLDRV
jgi:hypothetical protein